MRVHLEICNDKILYCLLMAYEINNLVTAFR